MSRVVAIIAALVTLALAPIAGATTVDLLTLDKLIQRSTRVVAGEVLAGQATWLGRLLVTRVRLRVDDCLKGVCPSREMDVHVLGGELDGLAMMVDGSPRFVEGEHVVVFLEASGGGTFRTVGMSQGKFVRTSTASDARLQRDLSGLLLQHDGVAAEHRTDPFHGLRFDDLRTRILAGYLPPAGTDRVLASAPRSR